MGEAGIGWRFAVTFGVVAFFYWTRSPKPMALNILDLATSLADHRSVELHEYFVGDVAKRDGHILSGLPPGASFAATGYAESLFLLLSVLTIRLPWLIPWETCWKIRPRGDVLQRRPPYTQKPLASP
jgi:hypothetical protein